MVHGADEVVDARGEGEVLHEGGVGGADEFGFEADEDVDLAGVDALEALGLDEVGFVTGWEDLEGGLGVVALGLLVSCLYVCIYMRL